MANPHIATNPSPGNNVLELPPPFGKTRPLAKAGQFLLPIVAYTDLLGGGVMAREYRFEQLTIDPDFEVDDLEPGTLLVGQLQGGQPHLVAFEGWTGRDDECRFVPRGDPRECYLISWGMRCRRTETRDVFRILGVLVGHPRRIPVIG